MVATATNGRLLKAKRARKTKPSRVNSTFGIYYTTAGGITVTPNVALTYSAVYRAITLISSTLGLLPANVIKRTLVNGRSRREVLDGHPVAVMLKRFPNTEQTPIVFQECIGRDLCMHGNYFAEIVAGTSGVANELIRLEPERMQVKRNENTRRLEYVFNNDEGGETILLPESIIHIKLMGDGIIGKSPIAMARQAVSMGLAAETFGTAFFGNGLSPSAVLMHPEQLSDEAHRRLTKHMEDRLQGPAKAGRLLVLEEDMKYQQMGIPAKDAQFLELRVFQVDEIARIFGVPPHMLAENSRATFDNITHQAIEFVMYTMAHYIVRIEQEFNRKLLRNEPETSVKYSAEALLRGDPVTRSDFYNKMFNMGAMTPNDIREKEDMDPLGSEADEAYIQVNMMTLKNAATAPPPAAEPVTTAGTSDESDDQARIGTFKVWFRDAVGRLLTRETQDLRAIVRKATDVQQAETKIISFYRDHEGAVREIFGPVWMQNAKEKGVRCDLDKAIGRYICGSRDRLLAVLREKGTDDVMTTLDLWRDSRADSLVDEYLEAYV